MEQKEQRDRVIRISAISLAVIALIALGGVTMCRKPKDDLSGRITALTQVSELGTVEYTFSRVYSFDGSAWYKPGDRKALYEAESHVKAGIRMDDFSKDKVQIDGDKVTVTLPHAEILSFSMPPEKIRLVYSRVSPFRDGFTTEEQMKFAKVAEQRMRAAADSSGILIDAENNAAMYFKSMFAHFGYEPQNVEVIFRKHE